MIKKIFFILLFLLCFAKCEQNDPNFKYEFRCGADSDKTFSKFMDATSVNDSNSHYRDRRLDSDGFKDFHIYLDTYNLEEEMIKYNMTHYRDFLIDSMTKAIKTLESLLKVKTQGCYYFTDEQIKSIFINNWDKTLIGDDAYKNHSITTCTLDIDLFIFARFGEDGELGSSTLASAGARCLEPGTKRPILGIVNINRFVDYSKINSREYFQSIIIHEFTHILGFAGSFFENYFHNVFKKPDKYNITRIYINSTKVVEVAKKYFNCPDIEGVELEDFGGSGTAGSHWEARILLGDYMNGIVYPEEQVISEFTLALLEDSGYYKANYYTGGLMRYGKNKGCKFVRDRCVNNNEIDPYFENEFYDSLNSKNSINPSCSSGRQSRTYYALWIYDSIPDYYQYFNKNSTGGFSPADYCPVARNHNHETKLGYYIGNCNIGNGEYGSKIIYSNNSYSLNSKNEELKEINGEVYSEHSFCFLSSLTKKSEPMVDFYSQNIRAVCYESFCSSESLTIKIHDNYIVCPRAGGKIQIEDYGGYFLCPDQKLKKMHMIIIIILLQLKI